MADFEYRTDGELRFERVSPGEERDTTKKSSAPGAGASAWGLHLIPLVCAVAGFAVLFHDGLSQAGRTELFAVLIVAMSLIGLAGSLFVQLIKWDFRKLFIELAVILTVPVGFSVSSVLFNAGRIDYSNQMFVGMGICFFAGVYFILMAVFEAILRTTARKVLNWITRNWMMVLFVIVMAVARYPYLNVTQRWDGGEYYSWFQKGIANFTYAGFDDFFQSFSLCNHPTLGFASVYLIGELVSPGHLIGSNMVSLILSCLSMWCFYLILRKMAPHVSSHFTALLSLMASFATMFFSLTSYFAPDIGMTYFFIFLVCAYLYDAPLLVAFFTLMVMQTKETGMVIMLGFGIGAIIRHAIMAREETYNGIIGNSFVMFLKKTFTDLKLYAMLPPAGFQAWYLMNKGKLDKWSDGIEKGSKVLVWDPTGTKVDVFGINFGLISARLKEYFLFNFNWIVWGTILICAIIIWRRNRKIKKKITYLMKKNRQEKDKRDVHGIPLLLTSVLFYMIFHCIFLTAALARYNIVTDMIALLIAASLTCHVIADGTKETVSKVKMGLGITFAIVTGILFVAESLYTVDPVTRQLFDTYDTGNGTLCFVGQKDRSGRFYLGDYLTYNLQYQYIDQAFDEMLSRTEYDPEKVDLVLSSSRGVFINGNGNAYKLNWDRKLKKRVFYTSEDTVPMYYQYTADDIKDSQEVQNTLYERALYVVLPIYANESFDDDMKLLEEFYYISPRQMVATSQGDLYYYEMTLLSSMKNEESAGASEKDGTVGKKGTESGLTLEK